MRLRRVSDWPETPGNRLSGPFSGGFSLPLTRSLIQRFRRSAVVSGGSERASGYSLAHCRFTSRPPMTHCPVHWLDRKSTRLNSSHVKISYAVFCLKKKNIHVEHQITIEPNLIFFVALLRYKTF